MAKKITLQADLKLNIKQLESAAKEARAMTARLEDDILVVPRVDTKEIDGITDDVRSVVRSANAAAYIVPDVDIAPAQREIDSLDGTSAGARVGSDIGAGLKSALGAAALAAGLYSAVNAAGDAEQALANVSAKTGLVGAELDALGESAKTLFREGVGDSAAEAANALGNATQQLGGFLDTDDIVKFTRASAGLAKVYDTDINEVIGKSRTAIAAFGLDGERAANIIAYSMQQAGNQSDDVLDTFSEYSQLVAEAGFSAEQFAGLLSAGVQAGTRDTDKLADVIKETGIRLRAEDYAAPFKEMSEAGTAAERAVVANLTNIAESVQLGDIDVAEALGLSASAISEALDSGAISEAVAQKMQVALSGSMAEDIGVEMYSKVFAAPIDEAAIAEQGAKATLLLDEALKPKGFEGFEREIKLLLGEIGNIILPILDPLVNLLQTQITPVIMEIFRVGQPVLDSLLGSLNEIIEPIMALVQDVLPVIAQVITPIVAIATSLVGVVGKIMQAVLPLISTLLTALTPALVLIADIVASNVDVFAELLNDVLVPLAPMFAELGQLIGGSLAVAVRALLIPLQLFSKIAAALTPIFQELMGEMTAGESQVTLFTRVLGLLNLGLDQLTKGLDVAVAWIDELVSSIADIVTYVADLVTRFRNGLTEMAEVVGKFLEPLISQFDKFFGVYKKLTNLLGDDVKVAPLKEVADTVAEVGDNAEVAAEKTDELKTSLTATAGVGAATARTLDDIVAAMQRMILAGGRGTESYNQLIRDFQELSERNKIAAEATATALSDIWARSLLNRKIEYQENAEEFSEIGRQALAGLRENQPPFVLIAEIDTGEAVAGFDDVAGAARDAGEAFSRAFSVKKAEIDTSDIDEQLSAGIIGYTEYARKRAALDEEIAEKRRESEAETNAALAAGFASYFDGVAAYYATTTRDATDAILGIVRDENGEVIDTLGIQLGELANLTEEQMAGMAAGLGSTFAGLLAEGQGAFEALGNAFLITLLDIATKAVLTYIPQIMGAFSSLGPFGIPAGLAAVATVQGLLAVAKSAIGGANEGYMAGVQGIGTPNHTDTMPVLIDPREVILPVGVSMRERELLTHLMRGGTSQEYLEKIMNKTQRTGMVSMADGVIMRQARSAATRESRMRRSREGLDVRVHGQFKIGGGDLYATLDTQERARRRRL